MPIFDYKCPKYGYELKDKLIKSFNEKDICKCETEVIKVPNFLSFQLKGSGFYDTDYTAKNKKRAQGKAKEKAIPVKKSK